MRVSNLWTSMIAIFVPVLLYVIVNWLGSPILSRILTATAISLITISFVIHRRYFITLKINNQELILNYFLLFEKKIIRLEELQCIVLINDKKYSTLADAFSFIKAKMVIRISIIP